jgi:hypothetical protein
MVAYRCVWLSAVLAVAGGSTAFSAPRIQLEIYIEERAPLTGPQEWSARLGEVGITGVQIRSGRAGDRVGVERIGAGSESDYLVTAALDSNNELVLPGGRFRLAEAARLSQWMKNLARLGPPDQRPAKLAFGMLPERLDRCRADLGQPVGVSTAGVDRATVVARIRSKLQLPLSLDGQRTEEWSRDQVEDDLGPLACGTALAYVLRPLGLGLVPHETDAGKLEYQVVKAGPGVDAWPVGRPPERPERDLLPALYEFHNANIENVSATKVLETISARLKLPLLWDYAALTRHGIQPDKALVKFTKTHTTYSLVLRKTLFQAGLKHQVRVDDQGTPFLWVSTVKPL